MHSCILNLSFEVFEKILGFLVFLEIFGLCFVNLIINDHALHSCCILTMFHAFRCVFDYVEMCAGRFGLGFTYDVFIFARHIFMHISCIRILSFLSFCFCLWCVFSLSLSLLHRLCMALKHKSTPAWNPLGFGSSSSSDTPHLQVWFHDVKAHQDFLENFQRWGVHLEHHVILSDFSNTPLPYVIRTWGWESLCEIPLRYLIMFIHEFYSNIHGIDTFIP